MKIVAMMNRSYFNTQTTIHHGKQTQLMVNFIPLHGLL